LGGTNGADVLVTATGLVVTTDAGRSRCRAAD